MLERAVGVDIVFSELELRQRVRGTMMLMGRALSFPYHLADLVVSASWTVWAREIERARSANHAVFSGGTRYRNSALPLDLKD